MTADAPWSSAYVIVGSDARMRVSSPTVPLSMGTLKSTRMKTRLPRRSRSRIESFAIDRLAQHVAPYRPFSAMKRSRSTQRLE